MKNVIKKTLVSLLLILAIMITLAPVSFAEQPKLLALTFDDGPSYVNTPALLDGLDERNVKVTLFVLGDCLIDPYDDIIVKSAEVLRRACESGHQIASHGCHHPHFSTLTDEQILEEVTKNENTINRILGTDNEYMFRLPHGDGQYSAHIRSLINRPVILWSLDPSKGIYPSTEEKLYNNIVKNAKDGDIILLHDLHSMDNVNAALRAIDTLRAQGFEFVTVEELFRLRGVSPAAGTAYYRADNAVSVFYDESHLSSHWAWKDILYVRNNKIMVGDGAGFKPNAYMTRAMAVSIFWRALGEPEAENPVTSFPDVETGKWYSDAVAWAVDNNIMVGYDNGLFGTDDYMTREQFYALLARTAGLKGGLTNTYGDDDRISPWARDSVGAVRSAGFSSKNDVELFRPKTELTRAEAAELIHWFMKNIEF